MTVYAVLFHVDDKKLATVLGALQGSAQLVSVTPTEVEAPKAKITKDFGYAGGKRLKGISGVDLCLQVLEKAKGPITRQEIEAAFVDRGFAAGSAGPSIATLVRAGKAVSAGVNRYVIKGSIVHLGATPKSAS